MLHIPVCARTGARDRPGGLGLTPAAVPVGVHEGVVGRNELSLSIHWFAYEMGLRTDLTGAL